MKHLLTKKIFEAVTSDQEFLESEVNNSVEGKDLQALYTGGRKWSYRMPRTGYFYVSSPYIAGEYKIERDANTDLWKSMFMGGGANGEQYSIRRLDNTYLFNDIQELIRIIWIDAVVRGGSFIGEKKIPYKKWLSDPSCPVWGKGMAGKKINELYLDTISGGKLVSDISQLFSSPEWQKKFNELDIQVQRTSDQIYIYYRDCDSNSANMNLSFQKFQKLYKGMIQNAYFQFSFKIKRANDAKIQFKREKPGEYSALVNGPDLNEIENKLVAKMLKGFEADVNGYFKNGLSAQWMLAVLKGESVPDITDFITKYVEEEPTRISLVPDEYRKAVSAKIGLSDTEADAIANATEFGII